jgi:hypothetical protein
MRAAGGARRFRLLASRKLPKPLDAPPFFSPFFSSSLFFPGSSSSSPLPALPPSTKCSAKICAARDLIGKKERGGTGHAGSVAGIAYCGVVLRCGGGGLGAMVVNNGA